MTLQPHLTTVELGARYETACEPVAKSHFHALWLISRGFDIGQTASILSFSTRWVRLLVKRYNGEGPSALGDRRARNGAAPTILTAEALAALKERLLSPPDDGGQWTGPKIARWLATFHGLKSVHDQRGWDALMAIGWTIQQPRPRHPEAATKGDRVRLKKNSSGSSRGSSAAIPMRRLRSGRRTSTASA